MSSSVPGRGGDLEDEVLALRLWPIFLRLFEDLEEQSILEASASFLQPMSQVGFSGKQSLRQS